MHTVRWVFLVVFGVFLASDIIFANLTYARQRGEYPGLPLIGYLGALAYVLFYAFQAP